jgi:long-chain acyl-CoA synthetase
MSSRSLYSIFFQSVKIEPDKTFVIDSSGQTYSYETAMDIILKYASFFSHHGIGAKDRVAVMLPNSPKFIWTVLALARLQAIIVPVHLQYKSLALRHILSDSGVKGIIFPAEMATHVKQAASILKKCELLIADSPSDADDLIILDEAEKHARYGGPYDPVADDPLAIFYSQGTVFHTRGVIYSSRQLISNSLAAAHLLSLKERDRLAVVYPFSYPLAFSIGIIAALLSKSIIICCHQIDDSLDALSPSVLLALPFHLLQLIHDEKSALPASLHFIITGGSRLPKTLSDQLLERFHLPVFQAYLMVEAGPVVSINTDERHPTALGMPLQDFSISLRADGKPVPAGQIGEIAIPATAIKPNFLNESDKSLLKFSGDWYCTGDLGYRDIEGHIHFVDRTDNRMNINGFDVYPDLIEAELGRCPGVREATVVGIPQNNFSDKIFAYIVAKAGAEISAATVKELLSKKLPKYQIPQEFVVVDHLPRNITGKIARQTLRTMALSRHMKMEEQNERV